MATQPLTYSDSTGVDLTAGVRPTKLFIGGISRRTTTKQLRDHFSKVGRVLDCVAMRQPDGRPRGFGYVTLDSPEAAEQFLLAPQMIDDRIVDIKPAVPDTTEKDGGAKSDDSGRTTPQTTGGHMHNLLEPCQLRMMWPDGIDGSEDMTCTFPPTLLPGLPPTLLTTNAGAQQHFAACEAAASWMQMYSGTHTWPWGGFDAARAAHTFEMMSRPHENAGRSCLTSTVPAVAASASPLTLSTSPVSTPPGLTSAASSAAGCPKQMQPAKIPTTEKPPVPLPAGLVQSQKNSSKNVDSDSPTIVQQESDAKVESVAKVEAEVTDAKDPAGIILLSLPTPSRRRTSTISTGAKAELKCSSDANGLSGLEGSTIEETKCAELPAKKQTEASLGKDNDDDDVAAPPGLQLPPPGLWHGLSTVAPTPEADAKGADSAAAAAAAAVSNAFLLLSTSPPAATSTARPVAATTTTPEASLAQEKASGCREMGTQTEETLLTCSICSRLERTSAAATDSTH